MSITTFFFVRKIWTLNKCCLLFQKGSWSAHTKDGEAVRAHQHVEQNVAQSHTQPVGPDSPLTSKVPLLKNVVSMKP